MGNASNKQEKLAAAKRLLLLAEAGLTDIELGALLDVPRMAAHRYRVELGAVEVSHARHTLIPTVEDIEMAELILKRAGRYPA